MEIKKQHDQHFWNTLKAALEAKFRALKSSENHKHNFFIHSSSERHLGCFYFLIIMNKHAMNIVEKVSLCYNGTSFGYMSKTGIAGS